MSSLGGDGRRYISGGLDAIGHRVLVARAAPRRVTDLLYSADRSLLAPLFAESGAKCFTFEGFRERVQAVFAAEGVRASVRKMTFPRGAPLDDEDGRWTRYEAGCTVLAAGEPGDGADSVVIDVFVKP